MGGRLILGGRYTRSEDIYIHIQVLNKYIYMCECSQAVRNYKQKRTDSDNEYGIFGFYVGGK